MCHIEHMVEISMRELHMKTGDWVRKAAQTDGVVVLERGEPIAKIVPFNENDTRVSFSKRKLVKGFAGLPKIRHDSARYISEDRERA